MKNLLYATLGIAAGYMIRKMQDDKQFDKIADNVHEYSAKAKKKVKDLVDKGENKAEELKERADHKIEQGKEKLASATK